MFTVIYRGFILEGKEQDYIAHWKVVANYFKEHRGAIGSTLHQASSGEYIAYSKWPNKVTRDASWGKNSAALEPSVEESITKIKACIDHSRPYEEIEMNIVEDFLS